jgi:exopolysaccharide biosynthesis polyprenyl glycosylphosphotransferase
MLATLGALYLALQLRLEIGKLPKSIDTILKSLGLNPGVVWEGAESSDLLMPQVLLLVGIIWTIFLVSFSVYNGQKNNTLMAEIKNIMLATTGATLALAGILFFTYRETSRILFIIFLFLNLFFLISSRIVWWLYRFQNQSQNRITHKNVIIIGAGEVGRNLQKNIARDITSDINFVGFLDDDPEKQISCPKDILGGADEVRNIVTHLDVRDVIVALPRRAHERVNHLVSELHDLPVRVWVVPDYFSLALHKAQMVEYAGIPMLNLRAPALNDKQRMTKRIFDISVTIFSMIILLPLFIFIAVFIKLDSSGPIFFRQKRVGENGRFFMMYKFRSMIPDADKYLKKMFHHDKYGNLVYKTENDPRITRVGKFLRRTSLDELPQLINVIRGDMSLVGPRPEIPYLVERYDLWQRKRFAVPQGITGWWQIQGRSNKPMHLHTEEDIYYIQNYSFLLDLKILLKTPYIVIRRRGAY